MKFQSFNLWGGAPTPLSNCIAYSVIPVPLGARAAVVERLDRDADHDLQRRPV